jgi:hypothetical protein
MKGSFKHQFKYNPLDISCIYLWDEKKKQFVEIPNSDPEFGPISLEEYVFLRRTLIKNGFKTDTATIMKARESLADLIGQSKTEKKALLRQQRKAGSRERDLGMHPKTSQNQKEGPQEKNIEPRTREDYEVEVPD